MVTSTFDLMGLRVVFTMARGLPLAFVATHFQRFWL